jgi:acyl-CoA synthetase (AMP-forming)/AMP-acid ligase II
MMTAIQAARGAYVVLIDKLSQGARIARTFSRAGVLAPLRPDRYLRMGEVVRREGMVATTSIALAARRCPDRTAIVDERGTLTWAELDRRASALAAGLLGLHGGVPSTIGLLCRNHRGFVEGLTAAGRLGADVVLLNTGFAGPQMAEVLEREGVELLIHDAEFDDVVRAAVGERHVPLIVSWTDGADIAGSAEELIAGHRSPVLPRRRRDGRIVLLTSGTTGSPKGARRPSSGGPDQLAALLERIPWRAEEPVVIAAPMFHAWGFGQLIVASTLACTMVFRRRFDPEVTLALVAAHRATGLSVVPVMLERIADLPEPVRRRYDISSLRFVTASGSRMRPDVVTRFMDEFGDVIYNSFNATEAGMITTATPADLRAAPDTAGRPMAGTEVRLVDDRGAEVPTGEVGRILVRSSTQFDGYTGGGSKAAEGGYMVSGDLGRMDVAGRLFVVGRDDEMIVSGGENVYPLEVEQALAAHGAVREVAVVGVDDEEFGQRLEAFVVLEPDGRASADELRTHVRSHLAGYKVPRAVTFVEELPRNEAGKVVKRRLLERSTG